LVTPRSLIGLVERRVVDWSAPVGGADSRGGARSRRSVNGDDSCSLAALAEWERDWTRSGRTARSGGRKVATETGRVNTTWSWWTAAGGPRQVRRPRTASGSGSGSRSRSGPRRVKAPAVLYDEAELAVRVAQELLMSREGRNPRR